jgi:hypothetical protein
MPAPLTCPAGVDQCPVPTPNVILIERAVRPSGPMDARGAPSAPRGLGALDADGGPSCSGGQVRERAQPLAEGLLAPTFHAESSCMYSIFSSRITRPSRAPCSNTVHLCSLSKKHLHIPPHPSSQLALSSPPIGIQRPYESNLRPPDPKVDAKSTRYACTARSVSDASRRIATQSIF